MELLVVALAIGLTQGDYSAQEEYALRKASMAYLEQSGINDNLEYQFDVVRNKYLNDDVEFFGGIAFQITRVAVEQRIVYKWSF